ncbi:AGAP010689-PA, partial [Anopheles gambiae str. PEST]
GMFYRWYRVDVFIMIILMNIILLFISLFAHKYCVLHVFLISLLSLFLSSVYFLLFHFILLLSYVLIFLLLLCTSLFVLRLLLDFCFLSFLSRSLLSCALATTDMFIVFVGEYLVMLITFCSTGCNRYNAIMQLSFIFNLFALFVTYFLYVLSDCTLINCFLVAVTIKTHLLFERYVFFICLLLFAFFLIDCFVLLVLLVVRDDDSFLSFISDIVLLYFSLSVCVIY